MQSKTKHFKTNVLLKSIIGKDLINDDSIAVLELVKNSYDANSKSVNVIFKNLKSNDDLSSHVHSKNSSKIIIQDFGVGMDEDDLEHKWLNIAYSEKKAKKMAFNRILAGAKGVGRFSCDRLGEYLDIYTRKKNGHIYHLFVDWKSFEVENRQDLEIQKIDVNLDVIPVASFERKTGYKLFEKGTILEISKLRSKWAIKEKNKWDTGKIIELKKSLEKLINPNQSFYKTTFSIFLEAAEFKADDKKVQEHLRINGEVRNKIFEKLDFTSTSISSVISEDGKTITTTITDKGRDIFRLIEKNIHFSLLKNVSIVLYYLNTYSKIYFARQTGIRSVEFGSVYLFINGFRIPPYGDLGDDWLGLEIRKGQGYARFLGTRELIGRMEIKDERNQYKIVSSREGLVKDFSYQQLVDPKNGYFYYTLKRLEKYVVEGLDWDRLTKKKKREEGDEVHDSPDSKQFITEFEKKVNAKNWKFSPEDEKYFEDQQTKNRRIISIIDYIIDVKPENILEIYINEDLIVELVSVEKERAKAQFEKIIEDLPNLSNDQIGNLLTRIEQDRTELSDSIQKLSTFSIAKTTRDTTHAFKSSIKLLDGAGRDYEKQRAVIEKLISEKDEAERKRLEEQDARRKAEEENVRLENELALEKEKNTFLRATSRGLNEDAKGLVHNIKHTSKAIKSSVDYLYRIIRSGKYKPNELFEKLETIKFNAEKVLKISSLITRANFKADDNHQVLDVPKYVKQYLDIYSDIFEKTKLVVETSGEDISFIKRVSALDIALILDDLISNSEKAGAKKVLVEMKKSGPDKLKLLVSDDGRGVLKRFEDGPEEMFELGVTETDGSGIGLHSVRKSLRSMQGDIKFVSNRKVYKGATFEITITK